MQAILERAGYEVVTADDGESGIDAIERARPSIALVDIGLPRLDGYGVARRIRETFGPHELFLVALTGYRMTKRPPCAKPSRDFLNGMPPFLR